jgi:hypothetical protein
MFSNGTLTRTTSHVSDAIVSGGDTRCALGAGGW